MTRRNDMLSDLESRQDSGASLPKCQTFNASSSLPKVIPHVVSINTPYLRSRSGNTFISALSK